MRPGAFGAVLAGAGVLLFTGWVGVGASASPSAPSVIHPTEVTTSHGFPDGAPARVTGGFGEDSCAGCHWERDVNEGPGTLRLSGVPERFEAGQSYTLTVELEDPTMEVAGFQVAARFASDTTQAGSFSVPEEEAERVAIQVEREIQFAQHLEGGTPVDAGGTETPRTRWQIRWTAPQESRGPVHFHLAAVAGDGDRSQMGDDVHALETVARP